MLGSAKDHAGPLEEIVVESNLPGEANMPSGFSAAPVVPPANYIYANVPTAMVNAGSWDPGDSPPERAARAAARWRKAISHVAAQGLVTKKLWQKTPRVVPRMTPVKGDIPKPPIPYPSRLLVFPEEPFDFTMLHYGVLQDFEYSPDGTRLAFTR